MKYSELTTKIEAQPTRSAWSKAVKQYALDLIEDMPDDDLYGSHGLLNGAANWHDYSYGGCSLIYDADIAERVCSPSELKKTREGERQPNRNETWLDVQTRALHQAARMIQRLAK